MKNAWWKERFCLFYNLEISFSFSTRNRTWNSSLSAQAFYDPFVSSRNIKQRCRAETFNWHNLPRTLIYFDVSPVSEGSQRYASDLYHSYFYYLYKDGYFCVTEVKEHLFPPPIKYILPCSLCTVYAKIIDPFWNKDLNSLFYLKFSYVSVDVFLKFRYKFFLINLH